MQLPSIIFNGTLALTKLVFKMCVGSYNVCVCRGVTQKLITVHYVHNVAQWYYKGACSISHLILNLTVTMYLVTFSIPGIILCPKVIALDLAYKLFFAVGGINCVLTAK